jgi:uncharacterized protein YrzB (UPF0473 family)
MNDLEKLNGHVHDEECGCGCGHDHDHEHEPQIMTLVLEDDSEMRCQVIGVFDALDRQYIALLPEGDEEALIYRYNESDNEEGFELENIDSDEEFEDVEDVLFQLLDEEEWDDDEEYEFDEADEDEE